MQRLRNSMIAIFVMLGLLALAPAQAADATTPDQITKKSVDDIIAALKTNKATYAKDHKKLYAMVDEKVLPSFDFERMSQWILGKHWQQASPEQQKRFTEEFRHLLVRTYATALLNYTDQKVEFLPFNAREGADEATVKTVIKQSGGGPDIPINYAFYKKNPDWKVYDVSIDGVSLVSNYRRTYASRIKREGLDALIQSIATANAKGTVDKSAIKPAGAGGSS